MTITAILKAAQAGDAVEVRRLLGDDRALAHAKGDHDKTALHWAAERDHREVAEILLDHGARIDDRTSWGATALEWAVNLGSADVARLLLARGARGMNLWIAAGLGDLDRIEAELARDPIAGRPPREGEAAEHYPAHSALMTGDAVSDAFYIACRNGHTQAAERLLDAGAKIDAKGYFGGRGVHWAAIKGHADMVEMLARRGADLSVRDDHFASTPAGWAAEGKHLAIAARLVELGATVTIWEAANYGAIDAVRRMLDADPASIDARGEWGNALHEAAFFGHRAIVELLLARGADRDAKTCRGETALEIARTRGHSEIAALLAH